MPQGSYTQHELVYVYDLVHLAFGTVQSCREWNEEDGSRHVSYGVLLLGRVRTVLCRPNQLRRACWTFIGPIVVPGSDVLPSFGAKQRRGFSDAPHHMHSIERTNLQNIPKPWDRIRIR